MTPAATPSTREQILDAAVDVISTHGLAQATTRRIAKAVSCSEATLYRHFADKEALFLAVLEERLPDLEAIPRDPGTTEDGLTTALETYARGLLGFLDEIVPVTAALFADPPLLRRYAAGLARGRSGMHAAHTQVVELLEAGRSSGAVARDADTGAAAALLLGACHGYAFNRYLMGGAAEPPPADRFVEGAVRTLVRGLRPQEEQQGESR